MEITTEITERDHIDFYHVYIFKRIWLQQLIILLGVDLILSSFIRVTSSYLVNMVVNGIILLPFFFGIPYFLSGRKIKAYHDKLPFPNGKRTYTPFASGIEITDETRATFLKHEDIEQIGKTENYVFIKPRYTGYCLLPIRCFSSADQAAHFISLITSGKAQVRGSQSKPSFTFKPGYLLAILCVLPVVGFFVGFLVLMLRIVHYKDRVFVIMGVIGMLITVVIYASMIYYTETSGATEDGFASIAQTQLNDLVKSIEFYKLQNGSYPDSLHQIETKDSFISIDDPIQIFKRNKKSIIYQYRKVGNKYSLFSVSKDGKPNTADDIYPTLSNTDTSKMGFIKK